MQIKTPLSDALYSKCKERIVNAFDMNRITPVERVALSDLLQLEEGKYALNCVAETLGLIPQDEPWIDVSAALLLEHCALIQEALATLVEKVGLVPGDVYKNPLTALDGISKRWEDLTEWDLDNDK